MQFILTIVAADGTTTTRNVTAQECAVETFWPSLLGVIAALPGGHVRLEAC